MIASSTNKINIIELHYIKQIYCPTYHVIHLHDHSIIDTIPFIGIMHLYIKKLIHA
jgi:hypothetical protein